MPLMTLWRTAPNTINAFTLAQVVSAAGDGELRDKTDCSAELRAYLSEVTAERLNAYIDQCLSQPLTKGGLILQDLINELGRRLDYQVESGLYSGRTGAIGFDGLWTFEDQPSIVVEVKTTDTYRMSLDTMIGYRNRLAAEGRCSPASSVLIVVGRQDTGDLEAQVRGSRHAWDIRIISAEALLRLVDIKLNASSPETDDKVRSLLRPTEYTKLDGLVDVVFSAARDAEVRSDTIDEPGTTLPGRTTGAESSDRGRRSVFTPADELQRKRKSITDRWGSAIDRPLIAKSRALFWDSAHRARAVCSISKRYPNAGRPYWYAYHPAWRSFLTGGEDGRLILGFMDQMRAVAIPADRLEPLLESLNVTARPDAKTYWHLHLLEAEDGTLALYVPGKPALDLEPYSFSLETS